MIVRCPGCGTRYRFDESRISGDSKRLKCRKCETAFTVERPAGPTATPPQAPAADSSPAPARTALLADEPREFRDFVASVLGEAGFEVSLTDNGEEALLLAGNHRFDLIVLNVYLRRLLGINVCERIKASADLRATPVILLGAPLNSDPGAPDPRDSYRADDFIPTSVSREELASRVRRVLSDPAAPRGEASVGRPVVSGDESEIRRLARIMISDIQMYHPEKFNRALRDGTFFEAFADELGRGKEIIDQRFGHLSNRVQILAAGIRDSLQAFRGGPPRRQATGS